MAFADPWDLTTPLATEDTKQGDDRIREMKRALDQRLGPVFQGWPNTDPLLVLASKITGVFASPHFTSPVVDSGGLTVTAGGISVTGNSTITGTLGGITGLTVGGAGITVSAGGISITGNSIITGTLTATAFSGPLTGNASTATALQTARTINGVAFDGTANITVPAAAGTLTGATLAAGVTSSSLTTVGVLAAPHMTSPVIDSGGLTVTAGTIAAQSSLVKTNNLEVWGAWDGAGSAGVLKLTSDISASASAGAATLPAAPVGFLVFRLGSTAAKVPYYAA